MRGWRCVGRLGWVSWMDFGSVVVWGRRVLRKEFGGAYPLVVYSMFSPRLIIWVLETLLSRFLL